MAALPSKTLKEMHKSFLKKKNLKERPIFLRPSWKLSWLLRTAVRKPLRYLSGVLLYTSKHKTICKLYNTLYIFTCKKTPKIPASFPPPPKKKKKPLLASKGWFMLFSGTALKTCLSGSTAGSLWRKGTLKRFPQRNRLEVCQEKLPLWVRCVRSQVLLSEFLHILYAIVP